VQVQEKQEYLAEEVAEGELAQAEADERLAEFTANVDELVDSEAPAGRGFGRGPGGVPNGSRGSGEPSGSSS